jgi:hypothetical protein
VIRLIVVLVLLLSQSVRAQDVGSPDSAPDTPTTAVPAGKEDAPSSAEEKDTLPMQRYGETDKVCRQWSDGCRTCRRGADGAVVCSNIGIACQPGTVTCTGPQDAPAGK